MNAFVNAVASGSYATTTTNGMVAHKTTANSLVDLFFAIGAMRGHNVVPLFSKALVEDKELALRLALWSRDVRGGAGEREHFRNILRHLEHTDVISALRLIRKTPEIGRWDDLLIFSNEQCKLAAFNIIRRALERGDGLCAKWMPRKGVVAAELRCFMGFTPKQYRKTLVNLTKVVETQMCAKQWDDINFSHVPSRAASIYKKAFDRNTPKFKEYVAKLTSGDKSVKVNAGAIFPHDVIKDCFSWGGLSNSTKDYIVAQWDALPNYVGDKKILPMIDVSGSMTFDSAKISDNLYCLHIAVSVGLYVADKNKGAFQNTFLTFSSKPELAVVEGDITQKVEQCTSNHNFGTSTNIEAAFEAVLKTATRCSVPQMDMPEYILILSDMQFDEAAQPNLTALEMIEQKYKNAGYEMPKIVFWNISKNNYQNAPAQHKMKNVALVSGFSPAILKSVLEADFENFTPYNIMIKTLMQDRYEV